MFERIIECAVVDVLIDVLGHRVRIMVFVFRSFVEQVDVPLDLVDAVLENVGVVDVLGVES